MTANLSISEELAFTTVRIECEDTTGAISTGTGFIFRFADDGEQQIPAIVTNKHVIEGASIGRFHMTLADEDGGPSFTEQRPIQLDNFAQRWVGHPDPDIDLCVMMIAPILEAAIAEGVSLFFKQVTWDLVPNKDELDDMVLLEDVLMVGYPNGIWDAANNMPIFRRGTTATHPNLDYNGASEFLIDAACFPGSSGSPVFLFNQGSHSTKSGGMVVGRGRLKLLGILYAGPQYQVTGEVKVVTVPTQNIPISISTIPNNLGICIKSGQLQVFEDLFQKALAEAQVNNTRPLH